MDFISRKDVLEMFSVSVWTLRRWEKQRGFPKAIPVSGAIRMYVKSDVDAWVEAHTSCASDMRTSI